MIAETVEPRVDDLGVPQLVIHGLSGPGAVARLAPACLRIETIRVLAGAALVRALEAVQTPGSSVRSRQLAHHQFVHRHNLDHSVDHVGVRTLWSALDVVEREDQARPLLVASEAPFS